MERYVATPQQYDASGGGDPIVGAEFCLSLAIFMLIAIVLMSARRSH